VSRRPVARIHSAKSAVRHSPPPDAHGLFNRSWTRRRTRGERFYLSVPLSVVAIVVLVGPACATPDMVLSDFTLSWNSDGDDDNEADSRWPRVTWHDGATSATRWCVVLLRHHLNPSTARLGIFSTRAATSAETRAPPSSLALNRTTDVAAWITRIEPASGGPASSRFFASSNMPRTGRLASRKAGHEPLTSEPSDVRFSCDDAVTAIS